MKKLESGQTQYFALRQKMFKHKMFNFHEAIDGVRGASQCIVGKGSLVFIERLSDVWIQNFWARGATRYCVDGKQFSHFSC